MNAMWGVIRLDGQRPDVGDLDSSHIPIAGSDLRRVVAWRSGSAAFGHLYSSNRSESLFPCEAESGQALIAVGNLYHHDDLRAALGADQLREDAPSDVALFQLAWRKWGEECVQYLKGDWALAAWDGQRSRLFLAQSAYGVSSLFYHSTSDAIHFASSLKGLLAVSEIPKRPDMLRVAQLLTSWPGDGYRTAYEGIHRLPPGQSLIAQDGKVSTQRYWFPEQASPLLLKEDDDYIEMLLEVYGRAVRSRLRSRRPVAITLSGGLDSSSVCALAARELKSHGLRLPAYTAVPLHRVGYERKGLFADETPFVEANCAYMGNVDPHFVRSENFTPLAGLRRLLELTEEPEHAAGNIFWILAILESVRKADVGVLLTGQAGNASVSHVGQPANGWRNLLRCDWHSVARLIPRHQDELWPAIKRHWLVPVWRPLKSWLATRQGASGSQWSTYSAINPQFALSMRLRERMSESGFDPRINLRGYLFTSRHEERMAALQLGRHFVGSMWASLAAGYGLDVRDPTMDEAVIEYCLRVPEEQYCLRGQYRSLIRRAMKGLLPDVVRLNEQRGKQAEDVAYRIRASKPEWVAALDQLDRSELARTVLDLPRMRSLLNSLDHSIDSEKTDACLKVLTRGQMVGEFLLRFDGK